MNWLKKIKKTDEVSSDVIKRSVDFEVTRDHLIRLSERRAWIVAALSFLMALVLAAGYFFVMPLKEKIPYIITVDPYSGVSVVAKLSDSFDNMSVAANESVSKANISNFITAYEAYDWDLWSNRDGIIVYAMAQGEVLQSYEKLYASKTLSPDVIFGRNKTRRIRIKSLILTGRKKDGGYTGATVRIERFVIDKNLESPMSGEALVVTLAFEYKSNLQMQEEMRIQNPLGFRVTAYRVEPEAIPSQSRELVIREISNTAAGLPLAVPTEANPQSKR